MRTAFLLRRPSVPAVFLTSAAVLIIIIVGAACGPSGYRENPADVVLTGCNIVTMADGAPAPRRSPCGAIGLLPWAPTRRSRRWSAPRPRSSGSTEDGCAGDDRCARALHEPRPPAADSQCAGDEQGRDRRGGRATCGRVAAGDWTEGRGWESEHLAGARVPRKGRLGRRVAGQPGVPQTDRRSRGLGNSAALMAASITRTRWIRRVDRSFVTPPAIRPAR